MSPRHRSGHPHRHALHISRTGDPLPFFQFMLYGADAFTGASAGARLVPVTRGRSLTLVPALGTASGPTRARRGT